MCIAFGYGRVSTAYALIGGPDDVDQLATLTHLTPHIDGLWPYAVSHFHNCLCFTFITL